MKVQSFVGVPPEIQAYAMAKYSRSSQSMEDSISEISSDKAADFLETFYFQYGHASIADLAHLTFAVEDISILAAIELEDENLWDGQERSTRHQDFRRSGYVIPEEVKADANIQHMYEYEMDTLFDAYFAVHRGCRAILQDLYPEPQNSAKAAHNRTLNARAFDVARYLLPLGTKTSVGQIVNARTLEKQISRLMSSDISEVRQLALNLRDAARNYAETPLCTYATPVQAAPTLVKYVGANSYQLDLQEYFTELAASIKEQYNNIAGRVNNIMLGSSRNETLASFLYKNDPVCRSFHFWVYYVSWIMPTVDREEHLDFAAKARGPHDELAKEYRTGYPLNFDLLSDIGAYRDLHRHRRCVQIRPPFTFALGFDSGFDILIKGLGPIALEHKLFGNVVTEFDRAMVRIANSTQEFTPAVQQYMLPLGYKMRSLFKMDLAEAAYIVELRTKPAGHFSYRQIAWEMYQVLTYGWGSFAKDLRVTNPNEVVNLLER